MGSGSPVVQEDRDKGMGSASPSSLPSPPQISALTPPAQPLTPTPGPSPANSRSRQTRKSGLAIPSIPSLRCITHDERVISRPLPSQPRPTLRSIRDTQVLVTHEIWGGDLDTAPIFSGEVQAGIIFPGFFGVIKLTSQDGSWERIWLCWDLMPYTKSPGLRLKI